MCFDVTITNDDLVENTESFSLLLQEERFGSQTGAIINPNQAAIFILDDNSTYFSDVCILAIEGQFLMVL